MVEGFRESEKDADNNRPDNPFDESRKDEDRNEKSVSRVNWGDGVAPAARNLPQIDTSMNGADPNFNDPNKPWRAGQKAAPAAERIVPVDPSLNADPNQNRGANPWRAGYPESDYRGPGQTYTNPGGERPQNVPAPDDWKTQVGDKVKQQGMPELPTVPMGGPTAQELGLNGVESDKRKIISDSLDLRTSYYGYLATGAFSGAASNSLVWGLDKKLASIPAEARTGFWKSWEARSPMMKEHMELARRVHIASENWAAAETGKSMANAALDPHGRALQGLVGDINSKITAGVTDDAAGTLLKRQQAFLSEAKNLAPTRIVSQLGTAEEVVAGQKLFDIKSAQGDVLKNYAVSADANARAKSALTAAESTLTDAQNKLTAATKEGPGPFSGKLMSGAAYGTLLSAGSLGLGYGIDKFLGNKFGYETKTDAATRFLIDGVAIPGLILGGGESRWKYAAAGGLFLSTRAYELISGAGMFEGSVQMSAALRPTTADALLIPAAATIPIINMPKIGLQAGGWKAMAAQVGVAWVAGRAYNGLAYAMNWDGHKDSGREQAEMFSRAFNRDRVTHNIDSFTSAVDKGKALGKENEAKLELEWTDWQTKDPGDKGDPARKMAFWRGNATLSASLGEFRLEEGSRLSIAGHVKGIAQAQHADKEDRILKGHDFDFAGESLTWLRLAARDIIRMRNYARANEGQVVDGVKLDAAYDQQLEKMQKRVESQIDKIYGEHKIEEIYDVLKDKTRKDVFSMDQALVRLVEEYEVLRSKDTKYMAKKARDIALGYLAESERSSKSTNGMDADAHGKTAWEYLQRARQLDPDNKDLPKIEKIAARVVKNIQPAINKQWENRTNNPFELRQ